MKLSIIMPCYNVADTIVRALDSILMQKVNFDYEILVIDDASTDNTIQIVEDYKKKRGRIRLFHNETNCGNAYSYYRGLTESKGDYFCVLDGDDYYTIPDKLQRQVDFLDGDVQEEYVGTATQYIIDLGEGMVSIPDRSVYREFTYADFLTMHSGYYHTATYMYRNIFRGNVPAQIGNVLYRGDTPRTMFHLQYSGKKIKVLDFVGSAYTFDYSGIWSSLKQKEQFQYQINYQKKHKENVTTEFERAAADKVIQFNEKKLLDAKDDLRRYPAISIEEALHNTMVYAGKFAFAQKDFVLKHAYYSLYIDSMCASLGYVNRIHFLKQPEQQPKQNCIGIVNGILSPKGGGIFKEIDELIEVYADKQVFLFVTNMETIPEETLQVLSRHSNLTIVCPPQKEQSRLLWLQKKMSEISPYRCYYYCSHRDVYGAALAQGDSRENIALFSFDHGYICGISNAQIQTIVAKRPVDYWMLKKQFGDKVILIPAWSNGAVGCKDYRYIPFENHSALITASGAARYYKIDGKPPYRYIDLIISLLKATRGVHYHFGELPDYVKKEVYTKLREYGMNESHFQHIEWAENIPLELLKNHVDIFIEPFPVVSYKLTLQVLSVGVPVLAHAGIQRMEITDFIPKGSMYWRDEEEFLQLLYNVDQVLLQRQSKQAIEYFANFHSYAVVKDHLLKNAGMESQSKVFCPDNTIMDITDSLRLFGTDFRISIMNEKVAGNAIPGYDLSKVEKAKKQIAEIRASKSFKVGFALTLPVRILKQLLVQTLKVGPQQAISLVGRRDFMAYKRDNPLEELHTLKESLALKVGDRLAIPFRLVHGRKKQSVKYRLEEQKKELNSIKRILQDSIRANQKTAEKIEQILEKQNQTNPLVPVAEKIDSIQQNVEELSKKVSEIAFQNGGQRTDAVENPKKFQPHTVMPIAESINSIQKKDRKNKREFK